MLKARRIASFPQLVGHYRRDASKFKPLKEGEALKPQSRFVTLRAEEGMKLDKEARTLEMSFSSEFPVERWFGNEILSHAPGAADLSRLNNGAPLLFNHDMGDLLGVVERAWIDAATRKGRCLVRFARTARGDEAMALVEDGILCNVSFMYEVRKFTAETDGNGRATDDTYTATEWLAYEVSLVTIPADPTVGVGRQRVEALPAKPVHLELRQRAAPSVVVPPPAAPAANTARSFSMNIRLLAQQLGISIADNADDAAVRAAVCQKFSLAVTATDAEIQGALVRGMGGIDSGRISNDAVANERQRAAAIRALGAQHKLPSDAIEKMVNDGISIEAARGLVLDHLSRGGTQPAAALGHQRIDMTDKEKKRYSILRAISALLNNDWSKAGFEREVNVAIAKNVGRDARQYAFFMPTDLPFAPSPEHAAALRQMTGQRAIYQVGTAAQGGNLVETELLAENFIDILRNMTVVSRLGATMLSGLVGNVDIPRRNAASTAYWVAESGPLTESEGTFDKVLLRPKTVGALSKMSRLMLLQSTPAIEMLAREDIMAVIALAIDLAALSGTGAGNQPTGIINQSGVGSVVGGTNGANLSFDHTIQLKTKPAVANSPLAQPGYAINGKSCGYLETQKSTTGQYLWQPGGGVGGGIPNTLHGLPHQVSQQLRSNLSKGTSSGICSELIYGSNWRDLLIGEWGVLEIMANPFDSTGFANGDVILRAFQTVDIAVRHGESFSVMSDALTPGF